MAELTAVPDPGADTGLAAVDLGPVADPEPDGRPAAGGSPFAGAAVAITGGGSGIGAAIAVRAVRDGARAVHVADVDEVAARRVADGLGPVGHAYGVDVTDPQAVQTWADDVGERGGGVDAVFSNAGVLTGVGVLGDTPDLLARWDAAWQVNVLAHVHLARAFVPAMLEAGGGRFVVTASAAGLLLAPGDAPYTVTKHAAVGFAEWLALTHGDQGLLVSVLCPLGVATPLLLDPLAAGDPGAAAVAASGEVITPERVADVVVTSLAAEQFLILPHPEVARFWQQKASDPQRWLAGVRRLSAGVQDEGTER